MVSSLRRRALVPGFFLTLSILLGGCGDTGSEGPHPKVLVIGIDGIRVDVLREVPTPVLDSLVGAGAAAFTARNVLPTVSGPNWSSMLTGVEPTKHGVRSNDFTGNDYETYPDFLTRIERERRRLRTFAVVDWRPLGDTTSGGPTISDRVDRKVVLDGYELGWETADSLSVEEAVTALREWNPDAMFVYLGNPDETSHEHRSTFGPEYREAIETADRMVGRLLAAMRERPTYGEEDWLVLVSTDHGRDDRGGHGQFTPEESTIFYIASGPGTLQGSLDGEGVNITDVAVTALAHLGIPADTTWGLDGKPMGLVR